MSAIAIITARGGSKRIPRKNIKQFCNKPIIAFSIEVALKSGVFDEVMVSTDDEEIADIARKYGAVVPFYRSKATSNDFATTNDVLEEVLEKYKEMGKVFDVMACIYPTAPFISSDRLKEAYRLIENGANSVMTVVQYGYPPQRALVFRNGMMIYRENDYKSARSQDLEPIYHDAGQFYFYKLSKGTEFIDDNYCAVILSEMEVQDIDNMTDWKLAEMKYKLTNSEQGE